MVYGLIALLQPAGGLQADEARLQANVEALMPSIWDSPRDWSFKDNRHIYSVMTREQNTHLRLLCNYLPTQLEEVANNFVGPTDELEKNEFKQLQRWVKAKAMNEEERKAFIEDKMKRFQRHREEVITETYRKFIACQLAKNNNSNTFPLLLMVIRIMAVIE